MKKIVVIPLDERPCNYYFNQWLALDTDFEIIVPPMSMLGQKKQKGDLNALWHWLHEALIDADGAVLAIDTLLYSGIIPSRLHEDSEETLIQRLDQCRAIKQIFPKLKLFAYNLIMRNPAYSSSEEEPDYYAFFGREIHRYGVIKHKIELQIATPDELAELEQIEARLPKEHLDDYLHRREINLSVNQHFLTLIKEGIIDFGIVPQDDSSPYGLTAIDQKIIRQTIDRLDIGLKAYMYPGADEVTNTLLARMINDFKGKRPSIYVHYTSSLGPTLIPLYEDRLLSETIKYQILAAGGMTATNVNEADLVLIINVAGGKMIEASRYEQRGIEYLSFRNLIEAVEFADVCIQTLKKPVIFGDVAYANGGDPDLLALLRQKGLLFKLAGYAGWNTSSNSLGTCIPQGMIFWLYGHRPAHLDFLGLRYAEDVGYCSFVRKEVSDTLLPSLGFDYFNLDGPRGEVSKVIRSKIQAYTDANVIDVNYKINIQDSYQPWNRMFETGLFVKVIKK